MIAQVNENPSNKSITTLTERLPWPLGGAEKIEYNAGRK
jgi:hypothetical protein